MRIRVTVICVGLIFSLSSADCDPKPIPVPEPQTVNGCNDPYSFNYNPNATTSESCSPMGNCSGYASGFSNSGEMGLTLYNAYYDQKFSEEVLIQRNFFNGIGAQVFILYEPSIEHKNAYASPDGTILFGYHMFYYTVQTYGELPVAGILAHEWGHRAQQTIQWQDYYRVEHRELEADAFSGYYMALAKQYAWSQIQTYFANVYASGSYLFNDPLFHGTHDQRLQSAYLGVNTAIYAMQNNIQYTYDELHSIFFSEIAGNIAPRHMKKTFKEVKYPDNLTRAYLQSLYPTIE